MEGPCLGEAQFVLRGEPQLQRLGAQHHPSRVTTWQGPWSDRLGDTLARCWLWSGPPRALECAWRLAGDVAWRARSAASQEGGLAAAGTSCSEPRTLPVSGEAASTRRPRQGRWPQGREEPTREAGVTQQAAFSERRGKARQEAAWTWYSCRRGHCRSEPDLADCTALSKTDPGQCFHFLKDAIVEALNFTINLLKQTYASY